MILLRLIGWPYIRKHLLRSILNMRAERTVAVLWATHLCDEVPAADRVIVLHHGKVLADTAPAKRASFHRLVETEISGDHDARARQLDENPGLWIRLHGNVRSLILPTLLTASL